MAEGISAREFAKRDGCSNVLVSRAVKVGKIKTFADGSLDPTEVGGPWRDGNRRGVNSVNDPLPGETAKDAATRALAATEAIPARAVSEATKAFWDALLREMEYRIKAKTHGAFSVMQTVMANDYAAVRTKTLAIPAERAPQLFQCKTVTELQALLYEFLTEALESLADADLGRAT